MTPVQRTLQSSTPLYALYHGSSLTKEVKNFKLIISIIHSQDLTTTSRVMLGVERVGSAQTFLLSRASSTIRVL